MLTTSIREQLHEYIEQADEKKIEAIYTLIAHDIEDRSTFYTEKVLSHLQQVSDDYASGKMKGHTPEETLTAIRLGKVQK